jgi:hypothetical protein
MNKTLTTEEEEEKTQRVVLCIALSQMLAEEVDDMIEDKFFRQSAKQAAKNTVGLLSKVLDYRYNRTNTVDGISLAESGNSAEELTAMRNTIHKAMVFDYNLKMLSDADYVTFSEEQEILLKKFNLTKLIP